MIRKYFFILTFGIILIGFHECKKSDYKKVNNYTKYLESNYKLVAKPNAKQDSLVLGYNFKMSKESVIEHSKEFKVKDSLKITNVENGIVIKDIMIDSIATDLYFSFNKGLLNGLTIDCFEPLGSTGVNAFWLNTLRNFYGEPHLLFKNKESEWSEAHWVTQNQDIEYQFMVNTMKININDPNNKTPVDWEKRRKEAEERNAWVNVENNALKGSVYQVRDYLKENLNDPRSYESISWSPVAKTTDGYMVRHKYRAKNAYGGLVIKEQVFYLNKQGVVINVVGF